MESAEKCLILPIGYLTKNAQIISPMIVGFTSRKELSEMFGCSEKITRRILRKIGIPHRNRLTPSEVARFKNEVGGPVEINDYNIKKFL